jgi:hypothetical protein
MFASALSRLNRLGVFAFALSSFFLPAVAEAMQEPTLEGSWSITFYLEPDHSAGATQCVIFTTTRTQPSGEERSGTWMSPSFPGWHGEWLQDGDHVQWFGFTGEAALASSEFGHLPSNRVISGEFNHFFAPDGTTSSAGGWVAKSVKACDTTPSAAHPLAEPRNPDPAIK